MVEIEFEVYVDAEEFNEEWQALGYTEIEAAQYWALLGELDADGLLIHIPEWLADQKIGYVDGRVPTAFIGRIDQETKKAILFTDSAAARPLSQLAHRIQSLEDSINRLETQADTDSDRLEWLQGKLTDKRNSFEDREDIPTLSDEWPPKSQLEFVGRRSPDT